MTVLLTEYYIIRFHTIQSVGLMLALVMCYFHQREARLLTPTLFGNDERSIWISHLSNTQFVPGESERASFKAAVRVRNDK